MTKIGSKTRSRVAARKHAFNLIFQLPFHPEWTHENISAAIENYLTNLPDLNDEEPELAEDVNQEAADYITNVAEGVFLRCDELDAIITKFLKNWELDRLARSDLALIRLALYEIHHRADISVAISINQAVELAKLYSPDESPGFVNGLLGQAVKGLKK